MRAIGFLLVALVLAAPAQALTLETEWEGELSHASPLSVTLRATESCEAVLQDMEAERAFHPVFDTTHADVSGPSSIPFDMQVCADGLVATAEGEYAITVRQGEPQKEIAYAILVTNDYNGPVRIRFEYAEDGVPSAGFLPDEVILAPTGARQNGDAIMSYTTPHKNGPNSVRDAFTIVATPYTLDGETPLEEGKEVTLEARTKGLYIPGPGPLVGVALLGTVLLARRR